MPAEVHREAVSMGGTDTEVRVGAWGWAIAFFGFIGGLIGYLSLRSDDPRRANHVMKWGLIWSLASVALWVFLMAGLVIVLAESVTPASDSAASSTTSSTAPPPRTNHDFEYGEVTVRGRALPSFAGPDDPSIGSPVPIATGTDFAGARITTGQPHKVQVIVFLAHWCPHCSAEAERLASYVRSNGGTPSGTRLVVVSTGSNPDLPNWPPSEWFTDQGFGTVPLLVDDEQQQVAQRFGLAAYPFIAVIDGDGKLISRYQGEQPDGFYSVTFAALSR